MNPLLPDNGLTVLSGMFFSAKKKNKTPPPPLVWPLTNHNQSNFVTPPADLNS